MTYGNVQEKPVTSTAAKRLFSVTGVLHEMTDGTVRISLRRGGERVHGGHSRVGAIEGGAVSNGTMEKKRCAGEYG
jgi:hypothetical protein